MNLLRKKTLSFLPIAVLLLTFPLISILIQRQQDSRTRAFSDISCRDVPLRQFGVKLNRVTQADISQAQKLTNTFEELSTQVMRNNSDQTLKQRLSENAQQRKEKLLSLMRSNPKEARQFLLSEKQTLPTPTNCTEQFTEVEGTLEITHADFFEENTSDDQYIIETKDKKRIEFHPAEDIKQALQSSMVVKAKGYLLDQDMLINKPEDLTIVSSEPLSDDLIKPAYAAQAHALGEQQTAVLLINFQNTTQPQVTKETIRDLVFNQTNNYYKEISYNKTSMTGDIFGWYTLPMNQSCDTSFFAHYAMQAADADVDYTKYKRLIVYAPFGSCPWGGYGSVGLQRYGDNIPGGPFFISLSVINTPTNLLSFSPRNTKHEFGHNLGVHHAGYFNCGTAAIAETGCIFAEYGDFFNVMGGSEWQMNAYNKEYIGWFVPSNIQTVTQSGNYTIEPLETNSNGLKALKILRRIDTPNDYLYLEYRQKIGSDSAHGFSNHNAYDGALIHRLYTINRTILIDTSPPLASDEVFGGPSRPALTVGNSLRDPQTGVVITTMNQTPQALTVNVSFPGITPPTIPTYTPTPTLPPMYNIGGRVFVDSDQNGTFNATTESVYAQPVTVEALQNNSVVKTDITDTLGRFGLNPLLPGTYSVRVTPPAGFRTTNSPTIVTIINQNVGANLGIIQETVPTITSTPTPTDSITLTPTPTSQYENGDANQDTRVDNSDINFVLQNFLDSLTSPVDQFKDGRINALDVVRVLKQMPL
jgi:hypothetical protein